VSCDAANRDEPSAKSLALTAWTRFETFAPDLL
jgi:hypothetical protein